MKKMTPKQFLKSMRDLAEKLGNDPEAFHGSADNLIELVMEQNGYEEGIEVFRNATKWYA